MLHSFVLPLPLPLLPLSRALPLSLPLSLSFSSLLSLSSFLPPSLPPSLPSSLPYLANPSILNRIFSRIIGIQPLAFYVDNVCNCVFVPPVQFFFSRSCLFFAFWFFFTLPNLLLILRGAPCSSPVSFLFSFSQKEQVKTTFAVPLTTPPPTFPLPPSLPSLPPPCNPPSLHLTPRISFCVSASASRHAPSKGP
jgi:hypothetical protein